MWDIILVFILLLASGFYIAWRLSSPRKPRTENVNSFAARVKKGLAYSSRLLGFLLFAIFFIFGGLTIYANVRTVYLETLPAPSEVTVPVDLPFEVQEISFKGGDDLNIAGWYVPAKNGAVVILLHGFGGNRTSMIWHATQLVNAGFGVLLYDERASGESEGDHRSYGWEDPADVGGALAYLQTKSEIDPAKIGIGGCSIGGQIALQGTAYYPQIAAVWADGPGTILAKDIPDPAGFDPLYSYVRSSNYLLDGMYSMRLGRELPAAMVDIIGKISPRPIYLVAGAIPNSIYGPETRAIQRYFEHAGDNKQIWIIEDGHHCDGPALHPEEYSQRMVGFFETSMGIK